ncbi:adenylate kinase [Pediococcus ethanolidurans]|uniref:Adenylate kinase n=2 Tax=Pediococcus ethanolidurans TaxID=319653 RepID=A0A1H9QPD1_9LACO|nr:adenylate kinase [Pediococcus ethanolidurans]MBU7554142.1 adenylate kinase [Pediococcus ethanolidurans]MCT4398138.1 adenylate kinase [Pediococcus ethanolidurans]MCV3314566.1 adenylate kinase [Pediococcus ethanolidurans]MCV3321356.1 adenylate kinase [Pediococcus ethanolidurans]MCV3323589.1 adenylate kinase [Pediococcus ethanolidurans]
MTTLNLVLMGLPGAGKGTQAQKIVAEFHTVHISTGDIFRAAMKNGTKMGIEAKKFIDQGNLVPDSVTDGIVEDRLAEDDTNAGFMLDGYPRNLEQANALDKMTAKLNKPINAVINIHVDPEVLIERLSGRFICKNCGATYHKLYNPPKVEGTCDVCGHHEFYQRDDDKPETVKNRIEVNTKLNTPLIDFYNDKKLLYTVNGDQDIDDVYKEIQKVLRAI